MSPKLRKSIINAIILLVLVIVSQCLTMCQSYSWYKWVDIGFKGRRFYLGIYDTYDEAVAVRLDAEQKLHDGFLKAYREWHDKGEKTKFIFEVERSHAGELLIRRK